MPPAPKPAHEDRRLAALRGLQILDSLPEQEYDDLVQIAAAVCRTPTALISLVDKDRQWFKARVGLDATETERDVAFCAHAILDQELFVVPDAHEDPRFRDNPLVLDEPGIRFYAGMPIGTDASHQLGTLCVIDYEPRTLSAEEEDALRMPGRQVNRLLTLRLRTQELERSNQELSRFAYLISHDLQAPLRTIGSYAQIIAEETAAQPELQEPLNYLQQASARMRHTIESVLQHSRIGGESVQVQVDLDAIVRTVLADLQAAMAESGGQVQSDPLPVLAGRPTELRLLMQNLIGNALKFVPPGTAPRVQLRCQAGEGLWSLCVQDNGIGIPSDQREKAFDMGQRLQTQHAYPGTGIGLAHCKKIVEGHGGRIWIDAAPEQGSCIFFTLPD